MLIIYFYTYLRHIFTLAKFLELSTDEIHFDNEWMKKTQILEVNSRKWKHGMKCTLVKQIHGYVTQPSSSNKLNKEHCLGYLFINVFKRLVQRE